MALALSRAVNVALVEDHADTRAALLETLAEFPARVKVVTAAPDAETFLRSLRTARVGIDIVLVDVMLPGMNGTELIRALNDTQPQLRSVALTVFQDEDTVLDAVRAGAWGYLLKDEPAERLVRSIEEAVVGEYPVSSRVAGFLMVRARQAPPPTQLSDREEQVATALASGLSYAECAAKLGISLGTVQQYVKRVYRKLEINSRKQVREWVTRYGNRA